MTNSINIQIDDLLRLAAGHDTVASNIEDFRQPPSAWLQTFLENFGSVAYLVKEGLDTYYQARYDLATEIARQHRGTAAALRAAARDLEQIDHDGGNAIRNTMHSPGGPGVHPSIDSPFAPGGHQPPPPGQVDAGPGRHDVSAQPGGPGDRPVTTGAGPSQDSAPGNHTPTGDFGSDGNDPAFASGGPQDFGAAPVAGGPVPGGDPMPPAPGGFPMPTQAGTADATAPGRSATANANASGDALAPAALSPFEAAVAAAGGSANADASATADSDLLIAKTLLAAVLAAADSPVVGLEWAVSVMRGTGGFRVFLTSNEGRGWLPPGVHLPAAVSTPWVWDSVLGTAGSSSWEGNIDPARILAEFGLGWGPRAGASLSALVSSGPIDAGLRADLPEVRVEGQVGPAYNLDLRVPTPDTVDRLGLTGTGDGLSTAASVPDAEIRARCVVLAIGMHAAVGTAVTTPREAAAARNLREQILATVQSNRPVPRQWWDELRSADDQLAAAMVSHRLDTGRVGLGALTSDGGETLRAMVFERRCTELTLLLADEVTRQELRDAVYAHEQIERHPQFAAQPQVTTTAGTTAPVVAPRPVVTAPGADRGAPARTVVPPPVAAGPPGAISVALLDGPPTITPTTP